MLPRGICVYISINAALMSFSTGLQLLSSLSNNCHWTLLIDTTMFELFEPSSSDFYFYNGLEHNTRQQMLVISILLFISQK